MQRRLIVSEFQMQMQQVDKFIDLLFSDILRRLLCYQTEQDAHATVRRFNLAAALHGTDDCAYQKPATQKSPLVKNL
jgi:hypothetical protein